MARVPQTPEEQKRNSLIVLIVAVIMLAVGSIQAVNYVNLKSKCTASVSGTVTDVESKLVRSRRKRARSHWEYKAHVQITEASPMGTYAVTSKWTRTEYQKGSTVAVYYNPQKPSRCYVAGAMPQNGGGFLVSGIIFLFLGLYSLKKSADGNGLQISSRTQDWE